MVCLLVGGRLSSNSRPPRATGANLPPHLGTSGHQYSCWLGTGRAPDTAPRLRGSDSGSQTAQRCGGEPPPPPPPPPASATAPPPSTAGNLLSGLAAAALHQHRRRYGLEQHHRGAHCALPLGAAQVAQRTVRLLPPPPTRPPTTMSITALSCWLPAAAHHFRDRPSLICIVTASHCCS